MTTAGFQAFSQDGSGVVQLDQDYLNYVCVAKGSAAITTSQPKLTGPPWYYTTVVVTGANFPMVAIRQTGGTTNVPTYRGVSISGSTWTFFYMSPDNTVTFDYWVFDQAPSAPASFGLEIFRADGSLAYHSGLNPMRIVGLGVSGGSNIGPLTSGRTYAAICSQCGFAYSSGYTGDPEEGDFSFFFASYVGDVGAFVTISGQLYYTPGGAGGTPYDTGSGSGSLPTPDTIISEVTQTILVDVTNL